MCLEGRGPAGEVEAPNFKDAYAQAGVKPTTCIANSTPTSRHHLQQVPGGLLATGLVHVFVMERHVRQYDAQRQIFGLAGTLDLSTPTLHQVTFLGKLESRRFV